LDGHDHRTVHHHVHIGRETERRVNNRIETTRPGGRGKNKTGERKPRAPGEVI
jgi:hypothetical protein